MIIGSVRESADAVGQAATETTALVADLQDLADKVTHNVAVTQTELTETLTRIRWAADAHQNAMSELGRAATFVATVVGILALSYMARQLVDSWRS